jgi:hypothetical protein
MIESTYLGAITDASKTLSIRQTVFFSDMFDNNLAWPWGPFYRASYVLPPPSAALEDLSQPDTPISGVTLCFVFFENIFLSVSSGYYVGDWTLYLCESGGLFNASFFITQLGFSGYATGRCGPQYKVFLRA